MAVGASGSIIGLTILWLLTELASFHYFISYAIALMVSVSSNYFWNSKWTFKGKEASIKGYFKYLSLSTTTLLLNLLLMFIFTEVIGLWYMLSAVIVTGIVFMINFIFSKKYVWSKDIVK